MKRIFLFCLLMLASTSLFAQWEHWEVTRYPGIPLTIGVDSGIWGANVLYRDNAVTRRLPQGEIVLGDIRSTDNRINGIVTHVVRIRYEGNLYAIRASNLSPIGDEQLPKDWITTPDAQKRWVISYYLDALRTQDRDTFLKYERPWIDARMEMIRRNIDRGEALRGDMWYNQDYFFSAGGLVFLESLVFFDAVIIMGGFDTSVFFINNITPFYAGYKINMSGDRRFALPEFVGNDPAIRLPFPLWEDRQSFDMIFIPDGDYMDVYLDSLDNHFATFAKVDAVILEELERLVRTNTVDLSRITTWPRRADGSMDFPPLIDISYFQASHTTTARLRLRDSPSTASQIVTTLDLGTEVQILETGAEATIDGITALWVRVLSANGFTGWCFSGYLEAIAVSVDVSENLTTAQPVTIETQNRGSGLPVSWLIISGVVLLAGVVFGVLTKHGKKRD